jgi:hypothetical protein
MKKIKLLKLDKYADAANYKHAENGIYKDLKDEEETDHRLAISFELEEGEDSQYPLEDLLDKFLVHVSDFLKEENSKNPNIQHYELAGELNDIRNAAGIIGKRVYNEEYEKEGKTYVKLVIA